MQCWLSQHVASENEALTKKQTGDTDVEVFACENAQHAVEVFYCLLSFSALKASKHP